MTPCGASVCFVSHKWASSPKAEAAGQRGHSAGKFFLMQHSEEPPKGLNNAFSTRPIERIRIVWGAPVSAATGHSTSGGVKQRRYALDKFAAGRNRGGFEFARKLASQRRSRVETWMDQARLLPRPAPQSHALSEDTRGN